MTMHLLARRGITSAVLLLAFSCTGLVASIGRAHAATLCVAPGGAGGCFTSIQFAVDAAVSRDIIAIAAGTYVEQVTIPPRKGTITLHGAGAGATILRGPVPGLQLLVVQGGGTRATISHLTLTGTHTGAAVNRSAQATFIEVEFTANVIGLDTRGKATVIRCSAVDNASHGLYVVQPGAFLTVADSTVSGNGQAGIRIDGKAKISNSTISGNGGLGVGAGPATVQSSTITANAGGGLVASRQTTLRATIVSGNGGPGQDCTTSSDGLVRLLGTSLIGDVGTCAVAAAPGVLLTGDPLLGPLQNNGGTTETHALLPGSPAIGAITKRPLCRAPDQRGAPRSAPCDLGSYEAP